MTGISQHRMPTASGLSEYDYPPLSTLSAGMNLNQIETVNKVPIPPEVMEHFKRNNNCSAKTILIEMSGCELNWFFIQHFQI